MRILLPPSETKSTGGDGPPVDLDRLHPRALGPTRRMVAAALVELCRGDEGTALGALGLSPGQAAELEHDRELLTAPTLAALVRYTGVLYDALDAPSLTAAARARVDERVLIGSALFGLVGAADPIPRYRLSASASLPGLSGSLRTRWRPALAELTSEWDGELVVDLRSGAYRQLGPVPGAVTVQVVTERADGSRAVVSHFNKHHKGLLARVLGSSRAEIGDVPALLRVARRAGMRIEPPVRGRSGTELTMVVAA